MSAIRDRVQRAFESLLVKARMEHSRLPTVASVAARAGIARSSMYRFHAGVVGQIQSLSRDREAAKYNQLRLKVEILSQQLRSERDLTKALARACAELAAQKAALVEQLQDERVSFQLQVEHLQTKLGGERVVTLEHRDPDGHPTYSRDLRGLNSGPRR